MPRLRRTLPLLAVPFVLAAFTTPAAADCDPARYLGDPYEILTGPSPLFPVARDFNEDGRLDLAVTNSKFLVPGAAGTVSIMLGIPGGLAAPTSYPAGVNPYGLVVEDFDEDGILDLAIANIGGNAVSILRGGGAGGVGNGTFGALVQFPVPGRPFQIVSGDYNSDGILDLAVSINNFPRISVLLGNGTGGVGNGTFGAATSFPLNNLPIGLNQGDFNSDGILDLVATEYTSGTIAVLLGLGTGGVGTGAFAGAVHYPAGPEPYGIEVFDYDKNGIQDLVVANASAGGTRILRGLGAGGIGNGQFTTQTTLPSSNTASVAITDVNEDGIVDLVTGETSTPGKRIHTFLGTGTAPIGDGNWVEASPPMLVAEQPFDLVAADMNGDTHSDLIVGNYLSDHITIFTWGCRATLPPPPDARNPVLTRVRDVPNDEGGQVYVTWLPSSLDIAGGSIINYRVYREIPDEVRTGGATQAMAGARPGLFTRTDAGPDGTTLVSFWESIANVPAQRLAGYGYTAPTTEDSTAEHPVSTSFFVLAMTSNIDVTFPSNVVSGASVDDLAPQAPANFRTAPATGGGLEFAWSPNAEPDFGHYRLYRSASPDFPEGGTSQSDLATDTTHVDAAGGEATSFRLSAIDLHGNEGPFSATITIGPVGVGDSPHVLALLGARPNPARGNDLALLFTLSGNGPARLELYDVRGRRVAAPSLAGLAAGPHMLRLDSQVALAPGVYLVRLREGAHAVERKLTIAP